MYRHACANRFYRLVWSQVHSCWVAVAEGTCGRGKSAARRLTAALLAASCMTGGALASGPGAVGMAPPAHALPGAVEVVAGQASVASAGNRMTVVQGSDKAILNWQSFDIGADASVRFVQPSSQSVALNRVLGADPSRIFGQLSANGKVFLVNPAGVLFGASARVDVGSLVASSLALSDSDFLAGRTTFGGGAASGRVVNEGSIRSADGGYVALLAPSVVNSGEIVAPNGSIGLGAGERVAVELGGDGLITLQVERGAVAALAANGGLLQADGGRVELAARGADALARATVNNTGLVQARGLVADGGGIRLVGDGEVVAGALDASSASARGGRIDVAGDDVRLLGATLDASGVSQGGLVRVGGAFQGGAVRADAPDLARFVTRWGVTGPIASSTSTFVDAGSTIRVDASGAQGQGGTAVVWSGRETAMFGSIRAGGAAAAGTVEVSSSDTLRHVDLGRIALGAGGQLLLDPKNITIAASGSRPDPSFGTDPDASVTVDVVNLSNMLDGGTSVTLQANNDITLGSGHAIVVTDGSGNGSLRLQAGRSIALNGNITTGNADLVLVANETAANGVVGAHRDAGAATITTASGTTIDAGSGRVVMTIADGAGKANDGSGALTIGGSLRAGSISLKNLGASAGSDIVIGAAGRVAGTGNGLIEIATTNSGSTFTNNAGAAGLGPNAGRYLVYSHHPNSTTEGVTGYNKHYAQGYSATAPGYAASGNWFLYSVVPTVTVQMVDSSRVYDGTANPALSGIVSGLIDNDGFNVLVGNMDVVGLTRNVGTYRVNRGALTTNLGYIVNFGSANFTITPRLLTATAAGVSRNYDGTRIAGINLGDNRIAGDQLQLNFASATFDDKNVGNAKPVAVGGITFGGADAGNYVLASTSASTTASITPRPLAVTIASADKVYDGAVDAVVTFGDDRIAGERLDVGSGGASFGDKNVGSAKPVSVGGITLGGVDAANYVLASTTASTTAAITPRTLTAAVAGVDKTYDGTSDASVLYTDDRIAGDALSYGQDARFADKNAGSAKAVAVTGIALGGLDAANYVLASTTASTTAAITPRTLTAVAAGVNKTYDGTTDANVLYTDDRIAGDALSYGQDARFADKNAGSAKQVAVTGIALGGVDAANYVLASTTASTTAAITPRMLAVSASGIDKVYDGSVAAGVTIADNRVAGDILSYGREAHFADKHAGSAKQVAVTGIALDGVDAGNYVLASDTASTTAAITPRTLDVGASGIGKVYDGSVAASVAFTDNRVAGDTLALAGDASFADRHAGLDKVVGVERITLSGADAGNYRLAASTLATRATITPKALVVTGVRADGKVYDGGLDATLADIGTLDGLVAGEQLQLAGPTRVQFDTRGAGTGKLVTASGYGIADGATGWASDYALAGTASTRDGAISQATLTVRAEDATRMQGQANPVLGHTVSGLVGEDSAAILPAFVVATSATPDSAPGTYAITVASNATLDDYRMDFVDGALTVTALPAPPVAPVDPVIPVIPVDPVDPVDPVTPVPPVAPVSPAIPTVPVAGPAPDPVSGAVIRPALPRESGAAGRILRTLSDDVEVVVIDGGVRTAGAARANDE